MLTIDVPHGVSLYRIRTESWPAVAAFTLRAACCHGVHSFGQTLGAGVSHTQRFSLAISYQAAGV